MVRSLYSGVAGLTTHQERMDVIGNNIANVNTHGFKASRAIFQDIFYQASINETSGSAAFAGNNPSTVGYGVQVGSIDKDMSMASPQSSKRGLDCYINGDGFFICCTFDGSVLTRNESGQLDFTTTASDNDKALGAYGQKPTGIVYTRCGKFSLDNAGNLTYNNMFIMGTCNPDLQAAEGGDANVTSVGSTGEASKAALREAYITTGLNSAAAGEDGADDDAVPGTACADITSANIINIVDLINRAWPQGEGQPLLTYDDLDSFQIDKNGMIQVEYNGEIKYIARIETAVFDNQEGLIEDGATTFKETGASGAGEVKRPGQDPGAPAGIIANKLEMSNVNLANEFSDMIVTQRGYQANARIITTSDSMLEELVNLKR